MPSVVRALALCLVALAVAGCGASNNKDKIEGKWKVVSVGDGLPPELRDAVLEFDGHGAVGLKRPGAAAMAVWRYKLLGGDAADFYDLPPDAADRGGLFAGARGPARVTIRIETAPGEKHEGRTMTLTDADGRTLRLTRVRG